MTEQETKVFLEVLELAEDGSAYKSERLREKHRDAETLAKGRAILAAAPSPAQEPRAYILTDEIGPRLVWRVGPTEDAEPLYGSRQPAPDARAAVIEECAKVCEGMPSVNSDYHDPGAVYADAIRALIGTP